MTYSILISSKQLQTALEIIALAALVLGLALPGRGAVWFRAIERRVQRLTKSRWRAILFSAVAPVLVRLAIIPVFPLPLPYIHDEFSYLLMADTFAHGRVTNPSPPEWRHFEAEYILLRPTYTSQYQPAQGLVMAAGQIVTGHPWWGVWASIGVMCGAICWALSYMMPISWALCGALGAGLQYGIFGFWMNSYFGGAVAATGGALVGGALLRMRAKAASSAVICGIGILVLFASRPLEGGLWSAIVAIRVWNCRRRGASRIVWPLAGVLMAGSVALGFYDYKVTGDPLLPPYLEGRTTYGTPQSFWWQPAVIVNHFDNPQLRDNYLNQLAFWKRRYSAKALWDSTWRRGRDFWRFFIGPFFTPCLFFCLLLRNDRRIRPWLYIAIPFIFEHATYHAWYPQQSASETLLITMILVQCWRHMRVWQRQRGWGLAMSRNLVAGFALSIVFVTAGHATDNTKFGQSAKLRNIWASLAPTPRPRDRVLQSLRKLGGKHLVFVHYASHHPYIDEWVFNKADIPGASVVFSREISPESDEDLSRAFAGYSIWTVDADTGVLTSLVNRGSQVGESRAPVTTIPSGASD